MIAYILIIYDFTLDFIPQKYYFFSNTFGLVLKSYIILSMFCAIFYMHNAYKYIYPYKNKKITKFAKIIRICYIYLQFIYYNIYCIHILPQVFISKECKQILNYMDVVCLHYVIIYFAHSISDILFIKLFIRFQCGGISANKPPILPATFRGFIHPNTEAVYYKKKKVWERRKIYKTSIKHSYSDSYSK